MRAGTPKTSRATHPIKGNSSRRRSVVRPATRSNAFGPATANCAQASVVEVRLSFQVGQKTCATNSRCAMTSAAAAVVVVIT